MPKDVAFHAKAPRDVRREWNYLLTKAGANIADAFLESVERTSEMLLANPFAGVACHFAAPKVASVRCYSLRLAFGNWLVFYAPHRAASRSTASFMAHETCQLTLNKSTKPSRYLAAQSLRPVSATLAISHFPSARTRLNRSVPQWSTLPSIRNSNGAHTTARSLSMRTSGS